MNSEEIKQLSDSILSALGEEQATKIKNDLTKLTNETISTRRTVHSTNEEAKNKRLEIDRLNLELAEQGKTILEFASIKEKITELEKSNSEKDTQLVSFQNSKIQEFKSVFEKNDLAAKKDILNNFKMEGYATTQGENITYNFEKISYKDAQFNLRKIQEYADLGLIGTSPGVIDNRVIKPPTNNGIDELLETQYGYK